MSQARFTEVRNYAKTYFDIVELVGSAVALQAVMFISPDKRQRNPAVRACHCLETV